MGNIILKYIPHILDDVNKQVDAKFLQKEFKVQHIKHSENETASENLLKETEQTKN